MPKVIFKKIGKYEIQAELGKGAMGIVYKCFDPTIERFVAIKTFRKDYIEDHKKDAGIRFKREAQAAGKMNHPNIVSIYDYGEHGELAYIVMQYIEGKTLKEYFEQEKFKRSPSSVFSIKQTINIMSQMLTGLGYAHENGIIHRDIKPANIMIDNKENVFIADFGIAKMESSGATKVGAVIGTPSYMSPEQFYGFEADKRSDIFSSGALLYQFITGTKPFEGSIVTVMNKVINEYPREPSLINSVIPKELDHIVSKAMAKDPDKRFQTAETFIEALKKISSNNKGEIPLTFTNSKFTAPLKLDDSVFNNPEEGLVFINHQESEKSPSSIKQKLQETASCFNKINNIIVDNFNFAPPLTSPLNKKTDKSLTSITIEDFKQINYKKIIRTVFAAGVFIILFTIWLNFFYEFGSNFILDFLFNEIN